MASKSEYKHGKIHYKKLMFSCGSSAEGLAKTKPVIGQYYKGPKLISYAKHIMNLPGTSMIRNFVWIIE